MVSSLSVEKEHSFYEVLLGKRKQVRKKVDRFKLIDDIVRCNSVTFLSSLFKDDPMVRLCYFIKTSHARNPKMWNHMPFVGLMKS